MLAAVLLAPPSSAAPPDWLETGTTWQGPPGSGGVKVVGLRFAAHRTFDRVVIDLRGPLPDYRTGYARRFSYDGSGRPVPILGRSGLWIGLTADGHDSAGNNLYTGPRVARPRFETLKALALGGDWEGQVTFVFALRHRAPYRVFHLADPSRMVIDFRHR
jgi:pimeloyl-ACP methyl ester carboxylesterase